MMPETLTKTIFVSEKEKMQLEVRLLGIANEYAVRLFDAPEINFRKYIDGDSIEIVFSEDMLDQLALAYLQYRGIKFGNNS